MEERELRVIFSRDGRGATNTKITLPVKWVRDMGVNPEQREVILQYDEEKQEIIIKKQK
ncbi:MAG: AbrB/MazE/SpoVT family DNA-binding domain-containing protein [Clostridia bacterium]|nr:AbrB/MazE/SpoVT family DNA-binding domain-containing protein [Clostridia bacterium]